MTADQLGSGKTVAHAAPRAPRRWLQFSLRSLLLVILLVAVFLGGRASMQPAIQAERARADREKAQAEAALRNSESRALLSEIMQRRAEAQVQVYLAEREISESESRRQIGRLTAELESSRKGPSGQGPP